MPAKLLTNPLGYVTQDCGMIIKRIPEGYEATIKKFWEVRNADEFKSIQDALDSLPVAGGMVFVPTGEHIITSTITMKSNQALVGVGASSKIVPSANTFNAIDIVGVPDMWSCTKVIIANLQLYGLKSGTSAGIRLKKTHWNVIQNVYIDRFYNGIFWDVESGDDADNNSILDCHIYDCINFGIGSKNVYEWACQDNKIRGNNIESCAYSIWLRGQYNLIKDNTLEDASESHIILNLGDFNVLEGNSVHHAIKHGIVISGSHQNTLRGNVVTYNDLNKQNAYSGIRVQSGANRNMIIGNICFNNDRYEIVIQSADCNKNAIIGNCCYGTDHYGAISDNGTGTIVEHNVVN